MQDGEEADLCSQMLGISRNRTQGLGHGLEEEVVYHLLVLISDRGNLVRHSEDDVEVITVEKLFLAVFYPLCARQRLALGTMAIPA